MDIPPSILLLAGGRQPIPDLLLPGRRYLRGQIGADLEVSSPQVSDGLLSMELEVLHGWRGTQGMWLERGVGQQLSAAPGF